MKTEYSPLNMRYYSEKDQRLETWTHRRKNWSSNHSKAADGTLDGSETSDPQWRTRSPWNACWRSGQCQTASRGTCTFLTGRNSPSCLQVSCPGRCGRLRIRTLLSCMCWGSAGFLGQREGKRGSWWPGIKKHIGKSVLSDVQSAVQLPVWKKNNLNSTWWYLQLIDKKANNWINLWMPLVLSTVSFTTVLFSHRGPNKWHYQITKQIKLFTTCIICFSCSFSDKFWSMIRSLSCPEWPLLNTWVNRSQIRISLIVWRKENKN